MGATPISGQEVHACLTARGWVLLTVVLFFALCFKHKLSSLPQSVQLGKKYTINIQAVGTHHVGLPVPAAAGHNRRGVKVQSFPAGGREGVQSAG
jgi:hypothetical protein